MKKYLIIGAGISGRAAGRLLKARGMQCEFLDDRLQSLPDDLNDCPLWKTPVLHPNYDAVVASPGLPHFHHGLEMARSNRVRIISEIDLALEGYKGRILAVTGTNGKSTTTAMCQHLLKKAGISSVMGGNIGTPLCQLTLEGLPDALVLEISSYQAESSQLIRPEIVIFTNFSPDHLERHGTIDEYLRAKMQLVHQLPQWGTLITERSVLGTLKKAGYRLPQNLFTLEDINAEEVLSFSALKEPHNVKNACQAALAVREFIKFEGEKIQSHPQSSHREHPEIGPIAEHLRSFTGLEHRCESVGNYQGAQIINDSKSTNVDSTLTALEAYEGRIILLIGGRPKLESMEPILKYREKISQILTFGEASSKVMRELSSIQVSNINHINELPDFMKKNSINADVILFSPACASFDQFKNFEDRGRQFKMIMKGLTDKTDI